MLPELAVVIVFSNKYVIFSLVNESSVNVIRKRTVDFLRIGSLHNNKASI